MLRETASRTAAAVCLMRAYEDARPEGSALLRDPYAHWFLGPAERAAVAAVRWMPDVVPYAEWVSDGLVRFVVARHRYMDDALLRARSRGVEQFVILGAGYDMRAYRFADDLAGGTVFEVDHPATARKKARVLAARADELPAADVVRVEVDFARESFRPALAAAGHRESEPTFFIWEGVSMYLSRADVEGTLATVGSMCPPKSEIVLDLWYPPAGGDPLSAMRRWSAGLLAFVGEPITFGLRPDEAAEFFRSLGFRLRELADADLLRARFYTPATHLYPTNYVVHAVRRATR